MNKKEVLEIKRRFKKEQASFTRLAGCYVDGNRQKVCTFNGPFLTLEEDVLYKYLDIANKTLSGTLGNNLLNLEFPLSEELTGGHQQILMAMKECRLENEELLDIWYDQVIKNYGFTGNYLILLYLDTYDVPVRGKDNLKTGESEELFTYLLCAVCPVVLSKPGLGYHAEENMIGARIRDWVVGAPDTGFMFPSFNHRSADIHEALFYTKNAGTPHVEFIEKVLGCPAVMTKTEQKNTFRNIVKGVLGCEEEGEEKLLSLEQTIQDINEEYEEAFEEEASVPLLLDRPVLKRALQESRVSDEEAMRIEGIMEETFGDLHPEAMALIDEKELAQGSLRLENKDLLRELAVKTLETEKLKKTLEVQGIEAPSDDTEAKRESALSEKRLLRMRPFKNCDAETILSWIPDEKAFRLWSADRYKNYPALPEDMVNMYRSTENTDNFYPMTLFDEQGIQGHLILRFVDEEKKNLRLGFVIVNPERRGEGLGRIMLLKAIRFAKEFLMADKVTLGVFENNSAAISCYKKTGFVIDTEEESQTAYLCGEDWVCLPMIYEG